MEELVVAERRQSAFEWRELESGPSVGETPYVRLKQTFGTARKASWRVGEVRSEPHRLLPERQYAFLTRD